MKGNGSDIYKTATPSVCSCPDCHGVLWEIADPELPRFVCRVGHGYSPQSLTAEQDTAVEDALWAAVRSLAEQASLARQLSEHWHVRKVDSLADQCAAKAQRSEDHAAQIRGLLMRDDDPT